MFSRKAAPLTLADLDRLDESYRRGAMLFGSDEHEEFIEQAIMYMPRLIAAARLTLPESKPAKRKRRR